MRSCDSQGAGLISSSRSLTVAAAKTLPGHRGVIPFSCRLNRCSLVPENDLSGIRFRIVRVEGSIARPYIQGGNSEMHGLLQDLKYALRMVGKSPGFSATVVLVIALGIGANTVIFGVVNALLFAPLPYRDADRIVYIMESVEHGQTGGPVSYSTFLHWKDQNRAFDDLSVFGYESVNLAGGEPEELSGVLISEAALSLIGIQPLLGRSFTAEDFDRGDRPVLLSNSFWKQKFASDPGVIGRTLNINGRQRTVIGIMPAGLKMTFMFGFEPALWTPLTQRFLHDFHARSFQAVARLKPGVAIERAQADMQIIARRIAAAEPDANQARTITVSTLRGEVDPIVYALMALLVGSILGLVCANVTNLLLARTTEREQEIAIRAALGAGRMRLARQLLTENLLVIALGCCLGVLMAAWTFDFVHSRFSGSNLGSLDFRMDVRVLGAVLVLILLSGAMIGLAPALQSSRSSLSRRLKESALGIGGRSAKSRLRSLLAASEVAFSLMLLTGAGLAVKSWFSLWDVDLGFRPENVLTMRLALPEERYPDADRQAAFFDELLAAIPTGGGVRSAGITSSLPTASPETTFEIVGQEIAMTGGTLRARFSSVSPRYFETMTIALKTGRQFTANDAAGTRPVAIVNEALVRRFWNGQNPVGSRIAVAGAVRTVIGILGDVRSIPLSTRPVPEIYVPFSQVPSRTAAVVVLTTVADPLGVAGSLRQAVRDLDSDIPAAGIMPMEQAVTSNMGVIQLGTSVLSLVSSGALILAALGIYGVLSYSVSRRAREIGIRMALGARPRDVLALVLRQGLRLTLSGLIPGLAISLALSRILSHSMFGVRQVEPVILASVSFLLLSVALAACYLPARRAAALDPIRAMRIL